MEKNLKTGYKTKQDILNKCSEKYGDKYILNIPEELVYRDAMIECECTEHKTKKYVNLRHFIAGDTCGCKECNVIKRRSEEKEHYIEKTVEKYGDKYTFDNLDYISLKDSGTLTCKIHGDFKIDELRYAFDKTPCPKCYEEEKNTNRNNEFLNRLKEKYGDKYIWLTTNFGDYYNDYVEFVCPKHGNVKQTLTVLLNSEDKGGLACPRCKKERANEKLSYTLESAIEKAKTIESCKDYDFSLIKKWLGVRQKYTFKCKKHGDVFNQTFDSVFSGHISCPSCKREINDKVHLEQRLTREEFIKKAIEIHGNKFDYSRVNYVNYNTKVEIVCPKHGSFMIKPGNHLSKTSGCPKCHETSLETNIRTLLENNNIEYIYEKSVRDLTGKMEGANPQRVDFFLPEYDLCIECQGEQHFRPSKLNSKMADEVVDEIYLKTIYRDKFKYAALNDCGFETIFFTKFSLMKLDSDGWYSDKKCFYDTDSVLAYIKTRDYESIKREWYNKDKYILLPFKKIVKTIWNEETCYEEAKKYKTRTEFARKSKTAYGYACKNGWIENYDWFIELRHKWTYDECFEIAKKCKTIIELEKLNPKAYNAARKNGWIKDYKWFEELYHKWTYEECFEIAKKYKTRIDFYNKDNKAFDASFRNKWLETFPWLQKRKTWRDFTYEECLEESKKYKMKSQFKAANHSAFLASVENKWIDEFFPKNK